MQIVMTNVPDEIPLPPVDVKLGFTVTKVEDTETGERSREPGTPMVKVSITVTEPGEPWSPYTFSDYFTDPANSVKTRVALKKLIVACGQPSEGDMNTDALLHASGTVILSKDENKESNYIGRRAKSYVPPTA